MSVDDETKKTSPRILEEAFNKFNETSARLEQQYELLLRETEQLRTQLEVKEREVKRAEKLATLGQTAAAMAHEVRNPLGAIKLFLSLLRQDLQSNPGCLQMLDQINNGIASIDNVVSNILHFSKEQNCTFAPINLHSIINEQVVHFQNGTGSQATLLTNLQGNPFVAGNEHSLRQVLYNLILNALQAIRYQGEIRIECNECDDAVRVTIRDNGPGIKLELLETLFEPFVTSKNEGTGLGLAIVRQIVDQHHGSIEVRNREGAEFVLTLPRNQAGKV